MVIHDSNNGDGEVKEASDGNEKTTDEMPRSLVEMDDDQLMEFVRSVGHILHFTMPQDAVFVLMILGKDGRSHCTANGSPEELPVVLRDLADRLESGELNEHDMKVDEN